MRGFRAVLFAAGVLLIFAGARQVSAGERASNLPGMPMAQEKHYHLVLVNPFVRVYEVQVSPHHATLLHQHVHDYAFIVFGDSEFINAVAGKTETRLTLPDTAVNLNRGMFSHIAINTAETPLRNITIELQHAQGEISRFYSSVNEALASGDPDSAGMVGVLESEEMRLSATAVGPSSQWSPARDERDRLVVMIDKIHNTSGPREHNSPFPAGMLAWVPAGKNWSVANLSAQPMRLVVLEFKDSLSGR